MAKDTPKPARNDDKVGCLWSTLLHSLPHSLPWKVAVLVQSRVAFAPSGSLGAARIEAVISAQSGGGGGERQDKTTRRSERRRQIARRFMMRQ